MPRLRAVAALMVLMAWSNGLAATVHVGMHGSDANPGSLERPLKSLAAASRRALPGDTVIIAPGTYKEMLEITRSGVEGAPIIYRAGEDGAARIDAAGLRHGVIIWNAKHIVVRGLSVENALRSGIHVHDHLDGGHGADFNRIEGNTVIHCGREGQNGIFVGGHHNIVSGNTVRHNGYHPNGIRNSGHGIYVLGNYNHVTLNAVSDSARAGIRLAGEFNTLEENLIEENRDFGITVWVDAPLKGENIDIRNNTLRNNLRGGISLYGQGDGKKPDTIVLSDNTFLDAETDYGIRILGGSRNIRLIGNTFHGAYRTAVIYVDSASLSGYQEQDCRLLGSGAFYFKERLHPGYAEYRRAYLDSAAARNVR
jgi:hypothetical protein